MSISDDEIRQAISDTFRVEADEHIQTINRLLLRLEQGEVADLNALLDEIAREAHTLKGASSILGLETIQETSHAMEEVFEALRDAGRTAPPELYDMLYDALDRLAVACQRVEDPAGADAAALERLQEACRRYAAQVSSPAAAPVEREVEVAPEPATNGDAPSSEGEAEAVHVVAVEPASVPFVEAETDEAGEPTADTVPAEPVARPEAPPSVAQAAPRVAAREPMFQPEPASGEETIRVPIRKLDSLMAQIGELLIARIRNDERLHAIRELQLELEDTNKDWARLKDVRRALTAAEGRRLKALQAKRLDLLERTETHLKAISHRASQLAQEFSRDTMHMSILAENLQEDIKRARMLPIATILDGFHRLVRDVARREGKQAALELVGAETEVDKRVLELIKDPLMHLLRNAVSHGIETPGERERLGKDSTGTVTVRTLQAGGFIQIEIGDDGRGVDVDRVVARAVAMGVIDAAQAKALTPREAVEYIFLPGLSTKEIVTDVSGRGVGLDVVSENIRRCNGQVAVDTAPGRGARVVITLPLTLSTIKSLLVEAAGQIFAIPIGSVERILRVTHDDVISVEDTPALSIDGAPVAVAHLSDVLGLARDPHREDEPKMPVVLMDAAGRRLGLFVDALVDEREIVVKPLGKQLARVRNVAGGTIVGSGDVILVLNPDDLVRNAQRGHSRVADGRPARKVLEPHRAERRRVVIVEDSITTRTLEKNILETAGYEVVACKDGIEALRYVAANSCDAVVTDVNMPNMDGFTLVERLRQTEQYRELPILLVSSLGSAEDRRRGMQVGANGYIVKAEFEQGRFLEMLAELM